MLAIGQAIEEALADESQSTDPLALLAEYNRLRPFTGEVDDGLLVVGAMRAAVGAIAACARWASAEVARGNSDAFTAALAAKERDDAAFRDLPPEPSAENFATVIKNRASSIIRITSDLNSPSFPNNGQLALLINDLARELKTGNPSEYPLQRLELIVGLGSLLVVAVRTAYLEGSHIPVANGILAAEASNDEED